MYKILIVEDEHIERDHLVSVVESLKLPFEQVLIATNGKEGLSVFEKEQPHIVIADINMPIMDGLQMIETIKKKKENTVCFILSSYDYFSYAQKALRIGVEDFILKPSDRDTICALLTKAIEEIKLRDNRYEQETKLIQKMHDFNEEIMKNCFYSIIILKDEIKIQENLKLLGIKAVSGFCMLLTNTDKEKLWEICNLINDYGYFGICDMVDNNGVLFVFASYVLEDKEVDSLIETIASQYSTIRIYSGMIVKENVELMDSYKMAKHKASKTAVLFDALTEDEKRIEMAGRKFLLAIENDDKSEIDMNLYHLNALIGTDTFKRRMERFLCYIAKEVENKYSIHLNAEFLNDDAWDMMTDSKGLEEFIMNMYHTIQKEIHSVSYTQNKHNYKKAITYIEEHYNKPITLVTVAEHLNITPFYLSRLINKNGKESFTEIVNQQRIKMAKQLIKEGKSFKEVTYEVGFTSQSYFTKIFRKIVKMSPGEYKNMFD